MSFVASKSPMRKTTILCHSSHELDHPHHRRLCETAFAFCLGKTKLIDGAEFWAWIAGFAFFYVLSAVLLAKATQTIPIGIAYPVWTGIGAVGAVLLGIFVFHEPATFWRIFFLSTLILSIVGLKYVG